jgi:hypothetical protein
MSPRPIYVRRSENDSVAVFLLKYFSNAPKHLVLAKIYRAVLESISRESKKRKKFVLL